MQKTLKKSISILLSILMVVSLFAIVPITASAEELMETISFINEQEVRTISGTHFTITPHADEGITAGGCWDFDGDYPDAYAELSAVYGETITKLVFHIDTSYDNYPIVKAGENRIAGSQSGDLWTFDNVNASSVRISANPNYAAEGKDWWCFDVFELDVYYDASNAPAPSDIVQELIDAIGTVTLTNACKEKIDAARSAYDNLSQADQALVNNYKTLTDAEAAYQGLVDQAAADRAIAAINAIGSFECTPQYKVLFDRANNTYNGLTDAQKALVTNYDVLVAARTAAEDLPYVSAGNFGGLYWAIDKDGVMTFAGSGETDMNAFRNNSSIRKVIINSSVTKLKSRTFGDCPNLTEVEFRNSNPKIDNFVFAGCGKLSKVTLAEGLTSIGYNMFSGCGALHELNLPRSVNYIDMEAFDGSGIQTLRIPYGLRHAVSALKGMGQLTTLMIDSDTSIAYTSGDFPDLGSVTNVYVPVGSTFKTQDSKKTVLAVKEQYLNDYSESDFAAAEEVFNMSMYDYGNDPEYALWEVGEYGYEKDKYEAKEVTVPGKNMTLTDGAQVSELFGAATIRTYTTAVSSVEALIDAIGTVEYTDECKEKVDAARAAYEELSDVQKAFISNETLAKLEAAEDAFVKVSVTWKNDDGTVLKTEDVAKGATPTYNGATPTKAEDENYTYTFSGWKNGETTYGKDDTLPAVTGDVTYTATFTPIAKPHEHDGVSFVPWTSTNSLPTEAGNYMLTSDVTLSGTWTVPAGETNLCLNGHGIKRIGNGNVITVSSDASLTLYDCDRTTTHYYTIASPTGNGAGLATVGESGTAFTGGYITGGNNSNGGGVIVQGTFTMNAGTIIGNNASNTGAGVFVAADGSFNMNDGALIGNTAQYGGGVGSAAGDSKPTSLVISGGTVAYNRTTGTGGGVHTNANGQTPGVNGTDLTIDGPVKIINNHTNGVWNNANAGGGVVIDGSGIRFNLSGNPVIKDNTAGSAGSPNNLYFYNRGNPKVNISGTLTNDNRIGVTMRSPGVFTTGYNTYHPDDDPADYFTSDDTNYLVKTDFNGEVQLRLNGSSVASVTVGETTIEYASFAEALSAWTNGSTLTLLADVTISSTIGVSGTKTLDLNGYGIKTAGGVAITVNNGADLTMKDSAPTRTGTGTNRPNGVEGGYLTGFNGGSNSACVVINAANFTMDGGSITGNIGKDNGAGVMINKGANVVMNGGSITNNKAGVGAGIYCQSTGKVTMTGGIVSDNVSTSADARSGGMLLHGSLTMTGGTVTRNTVGVRVWQRASVVNLSGNARITDNTVNGTAYGNLDMSGGVASQNCVKVTGTLGDDALIGITMKTPGVFTNSTDTSLNDASKFFSDNSSYIVGKNAAGQLLLGVPRTVTWKDDTGNIIDTTTVANGCAPTHAAPSKAADNYYTYTFAGWTDGTTTYGATDTLPAVSGDVTYTAVFTAVPKTYTVTWKNWNGETLATDTVVKGATPEYSGEAPTKAADAQNTYTFAAWDDGTTTYVLGVDDLPPVTADVTYTAVFTAETNTYKVTWKNWDGNVLKADENVPYGTVPEYKGARPEKPDFEDTAYTFTGWTPEVTSVTGDVEYTAEFGVHELIGDYYYVNGQRVGTYYGLIKYDGDFYYVDKYAKIIKNDEHCLVTTNGWTFADGTPIPKASYSFDADGKMIIPNGLVDDYYYINGVRVGSYYGLIQVDGDYYYVDNYAKIIKNKTKFLNTTNGLTFADGTPIPKATYSFDADGKMIIPNGIDGDSYYINGVKVGSYYGLVKDGNDYYYVDANAKIVKSKNKYLTTTNDLTFPNGTPIPHKYFEFDADGKMIIPNGIDGDFYYINGVKVGSYYGLVKDGNDYYYVDANAKIVRSKNKYLTTTNDLTFPDGTPIPHKYFEFDADGKMIF